MRQALAPRSSHLLLAVTTFAIGLLMVMQFRAQDDSGGFATGRSGVASTEIISQLVEANQALRAETVGLRRQIAQYTGASAEAEVNALVEDLNRLRLAAGLVPMTGPGVSIVLHGEITATDARDLVNTLWESGADGISFGEERIVTHEPIQRGDSGLIANGVRLASPYVVRAIGDPDVLASAMEQRGGFFNLLKAKYVGLETSLTKSESITLPAYSGVYEYRYAQSID